MVDELFFTAVLTHAFPTVKGTQLLMEFATVAYLGQCVV
jgi:hypothetical protein